MENKEAILHAITFGAAILEIGLVVIIIKVIIMLIRSFFSKGKSVINEKIDNNKNSNKLDKYIQEHDDNDDEDSLYEQAMDELENNTKVKPLWAKSFAKSEGNEEKAKALYIQYRVTDLKKIHKANHRKNEQEVKDFSIKIEKRLDKFLKDNNIYPIYKRKKISDTEYLIGMYMNNTPNPYKKLTIKYKNDNWILTKEWF